MKDYQKKMCERFLTLPGSYDKVDISSWQKNIEIEFYFDKIKEKVGKFAVVIKAKYDNKIQPITIPCIYIGDVAK